MNRQIEVIVINQNGWWSAICKPLNISGFGDTEQEALRAFERALFSNISARIKVAQMSQSDPVPVQTTSGGQVMRRIVLGGMQASLAGA